MKLYIVSIRKHRRLKVWASSITQVAQMFRGYGVVITCDPRRA